MVCSTAKKNPKILLKKDPNILIPTYPLLVKKKTKTTAHSASVRAGMWKQNAYLLVTAAVSCDHYKGAKLHRIWERVWREKKPISSY